MAPRGKCRRHDADRDPIFSAPPPSLEGGTGVRSHLIVSLPPETAPRHTDPTPPALSDLRILLKETGDRAMYVHPAFKVHPAASLAFAAARGFGLVIATDGGR